MERWQGLKDSNYKKKVRFTLGKVSQQTAQDIYTQLKINVSGYEHALSGNALQHIELRHGLDGAADQSMADPHDIARMGFVLENYDSVSPIYEEDGTIRLSKEYRNSDGSHAPLLQFQKRVDGTYYVVEAVPDSAAKQLRVVSAYMEKANGSTDRVLDMP